MTWCLGTVVTEKPLISPKWSRQSVILCGFGASMVDEKAKWVKAMLKVMGHFRCSDVQ